MGGGGGRECSRNSPETSPTGSFTLDQEIGTTDFTDDTDFPALGAKILLTHWVSCREDGRHSEISESVSSVSSVAPPIPVLGSLVLPFIPALLLACRPPTVSTSASSSHRKFPPPSPHPPLSAAFAAKNLLLGFVPLPFPPGEFFCHCCSPDRAAPGCASPTLPMELRDPWPARAA